MDDVEICTEERNETYIVHALVEVDAGAKVSIAHAEISQAVAEESSVEQLGEYLARIVARGDQ